MKRILFLVIISTCVLLLVGCSGEGNGVLSISNSVDSETPDVPIAAPPTETPEVKETPQGQQDDGAEKANLADMKSTEVDAVSGATPGTGAQSYIWDLTDLNGETVLQGEYIVFVEGTLRWKNYVLYSGVISIGSDPAVVQATPVFHYEESDRYAALTDSSVENNMIGPVTVEFIP